MGLFGPTFGYVFMTAQARAQDGGFDCSAHCHLKSKDYFWDNGGKMNSQFLTNAWREALGLCPDLMHFDEVNILIGEINGDTLVINEMVIYFAKTQQFGRVDNKGAFKQQPMVFSIKQLEQIPHKKIF